MLLSKGSLKYRMLQVFAYLGDAGIEFLTNHVSKGKRVYLGRKPYKSTYFERVLKEFTTTGYIERVTKKGVSYLRLTPVAKTSLSNDIPLPSLQRRRWDGIFRALAYDFPEKRRYLRRILREQIKTWGMGKFQLSLWITAHPLEEVIDDFIEANQLESFAYRFNSKKLSLQQGRRIAEKVWQLEALENEYLEFIGKWEEKLEKTELLDEHLPVFQTQYFALLGKDPHLPYNLLSPGWPSEEARAFFLSVLKNYTDRYR